MNWLRSTSLTLPALTLAATGADFDPGEFKFEHFTARSTSNEGTFSYEVDTEKLISTGGVLIYSDDAFISADTVTAQRSGEVVAEGNVRFQRDNQVWVSDRIEYNFVTGAMSAENFKTGQPPYFIAGVNLDANTETGLYTGYGVTLTADDYEEPAQSLRARSVGIYPDNYVEVYSATVRAADVPFFWFPYIRRKIDDFPSRFTLLPGYRSRYGFYALGGYNWSFQDWLQSTIHADYRTKRGFGTGIDFNYDLGPVGTGELTYYWTDDDEPGLDSLMNPIDSQRQRFKWYHQTEIQEGFTAKAMLRYQSDEYITRDFFESEYRNNTQPNSYLELHKSWRNFSLNTFVQPQINNFQETVERLPDIRFSAYRQQIGATPLYYESESSVGWYRREYANNASPDYSAFRGDSWHQLVLPYMVGGWLSVAPRAGVRGTYYSEADGTAINTTEELRGVFNTGVEVNFKAARTWSNAESRWFDVQSLRHIVQPGINYIYIPEPNVMPTELPQFDYQPLSIRPLPVDFPDYNSIDSIDAQNTLRMGLYNKLQTKRDGQIANLLQWHFFTDWHITQNSNQDDFGDLYSRLDFMPRNWLTLTSELRYDINNTEFLESNHYLNFTPISNWSYSIGHRYMSDQPAFGTDFGNNLLISRLHYKLNENWAVSSYHYYDLEDSRMPEQTYSLYRDLRSWTGALSFRWRQDAGGEDDFTVAFVFSLKQFPTRSGDDDRLNSSMLFGN